MKKIVLYLVFVLGCQIILKAQDLCHSPQVLENHLQQYPGMQSFITKYLADLSNHVRNFPFHPELHRSPVTIPVVVHVIYKNPTENISEGNIQAQINILNESYRNRNPADASGIPATFKGISDDMYIQFRLATRDPNGNPTNGITRKSTTKPFFCDNGEEAKTLPDGVRNWDPTRYLNIWVCDLHFYNKDTKTCTADNALGYATFPWDTIKRFEGVVMDYGCFGPASAMSNYAKGKVLVHEVGHFLGLWHIFKGGCTSGDEVSDTPAQTGPNYGNPTFPSVTCSNGPDGDMFMNHMDYVNDASKRMFTKGQRARALSNIAPGGKRASLAVSNGLFPVSAGSIDFEVFLEPAQSQLPSWKAALVMTHAWACQCTPDINIMIQQNAGKRGNKYTAMGNEIADAVYALALNPEEMLACYTIEGFHQKLNRGPIAILSVGSNEYYGLVIHGMVMDKVNGRAMLKIKDPMSIGPKGFFVTNQTGAEYQVDYNEFMTEMLEKAVINNKHIYIVYPPSSLHLN